jgi:predicted ATPase
VRHEDTEPAAPDEPAVFLISGIPGAGKSTVAALLAARFARGVHIDADVLRLMIVSGNAWAPGQAGNPLDDPAQRDEARRQLALRARHACLLADSFVRHGYMAVIDEIAIGDRLEDFLREIESSPLYVVQLTPSLDAVRARNAARPGRDVFAIWAHLDGVMRDTTRRVGLWLDSTSQTAEQTVEAILGALQAARVR